MSNNIIHTKRGSNKEPIRRVGAQHRRRNSKQPARSRGRPINNAKRYEGQGKTGYSKGIIKESCLQKQGK